MNAIISVLNYRKTNYFIRKPKCLWNTKDHRIHNQAEKAKEKTNFNCNNIK